MNTEDKRTSLGNKPREGGPSKSNKRCRDRRKKRREEHRQGLGQPIPGQPAQPAQQMAQARLDMETPICEMEPGEPVYDFFCRLNEKMRDAALAQAQEDRERAEEFVRRYPMPTKRKRGKK